MSTTEMDRTTGTETTIETKDAGTETATARQTAVGTEGGEAGLACTVDRSELRKALGRIMWAVPTRTPMPVLTGVLCDAEGDTLYLRASSLETSARTRCTADVARPGTVLIPAEILKNLADRVPDGSLTVEASERTAAMRWDKGSAKLAVLRAEDFPPDRQPMGTEIQVPAAQLLSALRAAAFAASQDNTKAVLAAIRLRVGDGAIQALACDALRIAQHTEPVETGNTQVVEALLVARDAERAAKVLAEATEDSDSLLRVHVDPSFVQIATPTLVIQIQRLTGRYPDIESLLPKEYPDTARVNRTALIGALQRMLLVVTDPETLHTVKLTTSNNRLVLGAQHTDVGTAQETVEAEVSPDFSLALNAALLVECLGHLVGDSVLIESSGPTTATRITGNSAKFTYYQMPIRPS